MVYPKIYKANKRDRTEKEPLILEWKASVGSILVGNELDNKEECSKKRMSEKTNKNIVLDIDATLVHTHSDVEGFDALNIFQKAHRVKLRKKLYTMKLYDVSVEDGIGDEIILSGIVRPWLKEFLDFCHEYFNAVVIWSAGRKKYVHKICDDLFPIDGKRPVIIYTYDDCDVGKEDYLKKPLKKLYADPRIQEMNINETNTFVLDDRDDTFSLNKKNGIQIPEFECDMTAEEINFHPDVNLLKLMFWLDQDHVRKCEDIRNLNKDEIFVKSLRYYSEKARKKRESSRKKTRMASPTRRLRTKASTRQRKEKKKE